MSYAAGQEIFLEYIKKEKRKRIMVIPGQGGNPVSTELIKHCSWITTECFSRIKVRVNAQCQIPKLELEETAHL